MESARKFLSRADLRPDAKTEEDDPDSTSELPMAKSKQVRRREAMGAGVH